MEYREGIVAVWRRDAREWWRQQYVTLHGTEPPDGWWWKNPRAAEGGQIHPDFMKSFGHGDPAIMRAFFDEMEARYRAEAGLPARGEGWVTQAHLARCVAAVLPGREVVTEASPDWLAPQRLDIYIPSLSLAIEYQGEQHYAPFDHLGGEEGFADRQAMDARKRAACIVAGVNLVEWRFDEAVTVRTVQARLARLGVEEAMATGETGGSED
jgi:hypothetical protein